MNPETEKDLLFLTADKKLYKNISDYLDGYNVKRKTACVESLSDYSDILRSKSYILTIADENLGSLIIAQAIAIAKTINKDHPLIIITEKEKQDEAAELIETGAVDYITTDNLKRLIPVINREIKAYTEVLAGKKARQEIKELQNIINSAEDEVYVLDGLNFRIKFANHKAQKSLNYSMDELKKLTINDITAEVLPVDVFNEKGKNGRKAFFTKMLRKDGTEYPAEATFQTAVTEGKRAVLVILHDITEKETAKQHAVMMNRAIEASASAVTITDEEYNIVYVNRAHCGLAGKSRAELIGINVIEGIDKTAKGTEFQKALLGCSNGVSWVGEYTKTAKDGEPYTVLGSVSPIFSDNGKLSNIIIVEEDISERIRIKSQLMHAQKMETVGELTSGIAHDFTNMLTAIGGFASIMKRKMDADNNLYTYVEKIVELTIRAKSLTQNLLTFSRKQMQAERVLSLNTLVNTVSGFLAMVIGNKLEIELKLTDEDINIIGDPVQLEQVIINLATNARDAVARSGILTISTDKIMISETGGGFKEYAVISVKDNGCGIDENKLKKIFEPFYTTKEEGKGTGLGLYIVSDIVTRHKGLIECKSEKGVGTEFIIKLPITEKKLERETEEADVKTSKNATILLVEDEKMVRESLVNALDAYGYSVVEAVNGKDAMEKFNDKSSKIDLVISDIVMPVMDGIEMYANMSAVSPDVKIIFTTGYVGETHKRGNFDEKDHIILLKPLLVKELIKRIEQLIEKKN